MEKKEIKTIIEIFDLVSDNLEIINTLSQIAFKLSIFIPKPTLIYELSKPINTIHDLNLKLLQFGLLVNSIPKKQIDKYIEQKIGIKSNKLKEKYKKLGCKKITNKSDILFYKKILNVTNDNSCFVEIRNSSTIDSLEILLNNKISNFDNAIIKQLRLLRSFRNVSEYAHNMDSTAIHEKFKRLGFFHPFVENNIKKILKVFLNHFLDVLLKLKSSIQTHISKIESKEILKFKSYFEKKEFTLDNENRLIFELVNKKNTQLNIHAYKIEFLFENKLLLPWNWHSYKKTLSPNQKFKEE